MQDLGWKRRWGHAPQPEGARGCARPASASNKLSCLLEMLHSKQLRSIKMLVDSNHGIYRGHGVCSSAHTRRTRSFPSPGAIKPAKDQQAQQAA